MLNTTGIYIHNDTTTVGCDSIVTLDFTVMQRRFVDDPREVCDSLRWIDGRLYTADTAGVRDTLSTYYGCDSIVTLQLIVNSSYFLTYSDTVCSSNLSYAWLDTMVNFTPANAHLQARLDRVTARGCDSTMTLSLSLWPSYYPTPRDTICDDGELAYYDTVLNTAGSYLHVDSTTHGCDSLVTLTLTVMPTYITNISLETCDSLRWIDGILYTVDTSGVKDTLHTPFGCDSVVIMQLKVHSSYYSVYNDTFCASMPYLFRGHSYSESGHYSDTLPSIHNCDSVLAVQLQRLEIPILSTELLYNCADENYTLVGHSNTPYLMWSSDGDDSIANPNSRKIVVDPDVTTVYTLFTDYGEILRCPATTTVKVNPFVKPQAVMRVTPQMLSQEHLNFEARDLSEGDNLTRTWYIDSVPQSNTERLIYGSAPHDADTCSLWLVVYDGHCYDTTIALLPVQRSDVALPNIFTPDGESNNRFTVYVHNIANYEMSIYNRRGLMVYHSTDINDAWDGKDMNGTPCPPGSYVYHLRYSTIFRPHSYQKLVGSVLLIR